MTVSILRIYQLIYTNVERGLLTSRKPVRPNMDKEYFMKKNIGLWIDHREAVIVVVTDKDGQITRIN